MIYLLDFEWIISGIHKWHVVRGYQLILDDLKIMNVNKNWLSTKRKHTNALYIYYN